MTTVGGDIPSTRATTDRFFAEAIRDYMLAGLRRPVSILQAGCLAPLRELGLGELEEDGLEATVSVVDVDEPTAREVLAQTRDAYDGVIVGDLRTVPLPPRGFDIVYCGHLLERVAHVELVLDRLVGALRPGGLLLIRVTDRDSSWALLDRTLPSAMRRAIWRRLRPGVPGPFPAVYEREATGRGIASYALLRGLVIAQRSMEDTLPAIRGQLPAWARLARPAITWLSRGRFSSEHDALLYLIRKPEDRSARVVVS
jgi:SAM-dependent methyltransferase